MSSRTIQVSPFDLVVFGGTGDLAARKLLPALYQRDRAGQMPEEARIIGVSRRPLPREEYLSFVREAINRHVPPTERNPESVEHFCRHIFFCAVDATGDTGWAELATLLSSGEEIVRAFYFAVSPDLFAAISQRIRQFGLVTPESRVVLEKPLGKDGESAEAVNAAVAAVFQESQVFRIDHYLGKETVQNLMALRFANRLFEPLWNSTHIDHIQITVAEELGVGERAGYYDTSGALRDMVQNHMLQLLCLTAMEPPDAFSADSVRDEKLKILKALKRIDERNSETCTVRGQYRNGSVGGQPTSSYLADIGESESDTETFVAIRAEIANWRWAGVPFYLRTGKRLAARRSEIVITFRPISHSIFDHTAGRISQNRLVIRLQPDEGMNLEVMIKDPGPGGMRLRRIPLDMSFAETFGVANPDAYERLLMDVIRGNQTLFMRHDEVSAAWRWIDPILTAWRSGNRRVHLYSAGTWGPSAAVALIERDGRTWLEDAD
ncbi:MAG: glucose-6-phosphate dehydrogenase [Candidatus Dactylopiibacterium carminicum]|uniref:Glucose-6-phosphate 1-dehydrogenase n=1 Tax=Candidatus Dactylopiibacterium carminicum TaxID=857335 RepID=A0A272ENP8_9RHOO|nr:glucose-6-phosphate dehydrogenase [Candidatus Dactylopiibacterium carminicum]KAF7598102.1 glucose-6-phosphate dehydrogenase [Candidatus Dactylopiibacterium carminicum]PAS91728.1 MAG: glucose-6-phosphate dehydrogenase [Candidatus Dactylopiibacterium carminicum]PAS93868.1 MAG: glucose-6-phosphate dehydrogenase [Candidatus Dactylopiibacterium carminicum]PAS96619.1 MAG: glucose-6-phosphate dehydrogenase [Candidatus Dactylopiibacterium carminicum]